MSATPFTPEQEARIAEIVRSARHPECYPGPDLIDEALEVMDRLLHEERERSRLLVLASDAPESDEVSPCIASFGIDIISSAGAPGDELLRIDVRTDGGLAAAAQLALDALSLALPLVEREGEILAIRHDFPDAFVVRAIVPNEANDLNGRRNSIEHLRSFVSDSASDTIAEGEGVATLPEGGA